MTVPLVQLNGKRGNMKSYDLVSVEDSGKPHTL